MEIKYEISNDANLKKIALLALTNELYVKEEGYRLSGILKNIIKSNNRFVYGDYIWTKDNIRHKRPKYIISLARDRTNLIGVLLIYKFESHVYVKPEYRNKRIATQLHIETAKVYDLTANLLGGLNKSDGTF